MPDPGGTGLANPISTSVILADGFLTATALLATGLELFVAAHRGQSRRLWWALVLLGLFFLLAGRVGVHFVSVVSDAPVGAAGGVIRDLGFFTGRLLILVALPAYLVRAFPPVRPRGFVPAAAVFSALSLWMLWWVVTDSNPPWRDAVNYLALAAFLLPVVVAVGQVLGVLGKAPLWQRREVRTYAFWGAAIVTMTVLHLMTQGGAGLWSYLPLNLAYAGFFLSSSAFSVAALVRRSEAGAAPAPLPAADWGLSPREEEIVALVQQGFSNAEVGERLFISPKTVENHLYRIYQKLGVKNRVQLSRKVAPR